MGSIRFIPVESEDPFTRVPKVTHRRGPAKLDALLDLGLLTYLISNTAEWVTSTEEIAKDWQEGKTALRAAMTRLEAKGHVVRHKRQLARGELLDDKPAGGQWVTDTYVSADPRALDPIRAEIRRREEARAARKAARAKAKTNPASPVDNSAGQPVDNSGPAEAAEDVFPGHTGARFPDVGTPDVGTPSPGVPESGPPFSNKKIKEETREKNNTTPPSAPTGGAGRAEGQAAEEGEEVDQFPNPHPKAGHRGASGQLPPLQDVDQSADPYADLVRDLVRERPDWSPGQIRAVLADPDVQARPDEVVRLAFMLMASDPRTEFPRRLTAEGHPFWRQAARILRPPAEPERETASASAPRPRCGDCGGTGLITVVRPGLPDAAVRCTHPNTLATAGA